MVQVEKTTGMLVNELRNRLLQRKDYLNTLDDEMVSTYYSGEIDRIYTIFKLMENGKL